MSQSTATNPPATPADDLSVFVAQPDHPAVKPELSGCAERSALCSHLKPAPQSEPRGVCMAMTILVVDDSVTMVLSLKTTLAMSGFVVETAANGQEALRKLQSGLKPNLIITDINMPVMGGMDLIKNARAMPGLRFVPILTLTTKS